MDPQNPYAPVDLGTEEPLPSLEPEGPREHLPPGRWIRKRLFNNRYNSLLTIVLVTVLGFATYRVGRFLFVTARWDPVVTNLENFMIGRFPRAERWRVIAQVILWAATIGLGWGAAVAGARFRATQSGVEYLEDRSLAKLRRYWALVALVVVLLVTAGTLGPAVVAICSVAAGAGLQKLGARVPGRWIGAVWALVGALGVLGFQIVSGFDGLAWLWTAVFVAAGVNSMLSQRGFPDTRRERQTRLAAAAAVFIAAYCIYALLLPALIETEGVGWDNWEGFRVNLLAAAVATVLAFPLGLLLALARRSGFPALRIMATAYIELIRGVPLITLLLMAQYFIGFFLNTSTPLSLVSRALAAMTLFTAAYIAEIVRGGLQAVPNGQVEAGNAIGLSPWKTTRLIVLPQALRAVIPAMVGQFISLFKDTSLLYIIGVAEILKIRELVHAQPAFRGYGIAETLIFVMFAFWAVSFTMSRESQRLERRLGVGER